MNRGKKPLSEEQKAKILNELHRDAALRNRGYRERALKLFPHVCASCGRELSGKRLRELTVHHKDHNHDNNPPDGSNWELLCIYCHDHEHEKDLMAGHGRPGGALDLAPAPSVFSPFEGLDHLLAADAPDPADMTDSVPTRPDNNKEPAS